MRIIITDQEWYYGRYILWIFIVIISVVGGAYMYLRNTKENAEQNFIISTTPINSLTSKEENNSKVPKEDPTQHNEGKKDNSISVTTTYLDVKNQKEIAIRSPSNNSTTTEVIGVAIQGAVKNPGMYWVEPNTRLQSLLDLAGGPLPNAELRYINLAAPLIDGTTLVIPEKAKIVKEGNFISVKGPTQPVGYTYTSELNYTVSATEPNNKSQESKTYKSENVTSEETSNLINLNTASQKELESLPGIGPVLANSIIEYRKNKPFQSVEELLNVSGIGPKRFEKIQHLVTVSQ